MLIQKNLYLINSMEINQIIFKDIVTIRSVSIWIVSGVMVLLMVSGLCV